jgi:hypothetical protein
VPDRALDDARVDGPHEELPVLGGEEVRHPAGVGELAEGGVRVPQREGLERGRPRQELDDRAGIDPAREEGADRHIAHRVLGGHATEQVHQRVGRRLDLLLLELPVARDPDASVGFEHEEAAGLELPDVAQQRPRGGRELVAHDVEESLGVDRPRHLRIAEQGLDLRGEAEAAAGQRVVERLEPQPVAGQHEAAAAGVPDRVGEHAREEADGVGPVLLVGVDDHLRVGPAAKAVTARFESVTDVEVVVDLAVVGDPDRAVLVAERLAAVLAQIDDREAPMAQRRPVVEIGPVGIRSAVGDRVLHPLEQILVAPVEPADAAHDRRPPKIPPAGRNPLRRPALISSQRRPSRQGSGGRIRRRLPVIG